jgi:hypothetical protein
MSEDDPAAGLTAARAGGLDNTNAQIDSATGRRSTTRRCIGPRGEPLAAGARRGDSPMTPSTPRSTTWMTSRGAKTSTVLQAPNANKANADGSASCGTRAEAEAQVTP